MKFTLQGIKLSPSRLAVLVVFGLAATAFAQVAGNPICQGNVVDRFLCHKMINLRTQIFALETQAELMQVNPGRMQAVARGLQQAAREALQLVGPGLPEHRQGLSGVILMSEQLEQFASKNDGQMMVLANNMRTNCATCHAQAQPPGDIGWNDIFKNDWSQISKHCRQPNKNPYLCKSMHALLATQAYNHTAYEGHVENYEMTLSTANEIIRILTDLKDKGFNHLPEDKRQQTLAAANEVIKMSENKDRRVFEKARDIMVTCKSCHSGLTHDDVARPWQPANFSRAIN